MIETFFIFVLSVLILFVGMVFAIAIVTTWQKLERVLDIYLKDTKPDERKGK